MFICVVVSPGVLDHPRRRFLDRPPLGLRILFPPKLGRVSLYRDCLPFRPGPFLGRGGRQVVRLPLLEGTQRSFHPDIPGVSMCLCVHRRVHRSIPPTSHVPRVRVSLSLLPDSLGASLLSDRRREYEESCHLIDVLLVFFSCHQWNTP